MAEKWHKTAWRHHDISTPILSAATIWAAESVASLIHHNNYVDGFAIAGAAGAGAATWGKDRHFWLQVYLTVTTIVTLAWILYAEYVGPFHARTFAALAIAGVFLGVLYPGFAFVERRDKRRVEDRAAALARRKARRGDWPALFEQLGCHGITQEGTVAETRCGQTLTFRIAPTGKVTFGRLQPLAVTIETILDLPKGAVRFRQPRDSSATFFVDLITRDVLGEELPLPDDFEPRSINDPFSIGLDEFGEDIMVLLREVATLIFAPRGSGKSNLTTVLITMLARCTDVVIWVIDLKGGRVARPWLRPWFERRTHRPVLDWVATTPEEAHLMLLAGQTAIDHRSSTGEGEKITPCPEQPAIFIIADEGANLTGIRAAGGLKRSDLAFDVIGRGRSEAVDVIGSFLRATVSMTGSGDLKAQSQLRISLGAESAADGTAALDSPGDGAIVANFHHPGSIFVKRSSNDKQTGKVFRIESGQVPLIAEICSPWRPELEPDLEKALGEVYAKRWDLDRCGHLMPLDMQKRLGYKPKKIDPVSLLPASPAPVPSPPALPPRRGATMQTAVANPAANLPTIPPPPKDITPAYRTVDGRPLPRKYSDEEVEKLFGHYRADLGEIEEDLKKSGTQLHRGRVRMLELIKNSGKAGIKPGQLVDLLNAEQIDCVRQTVQTWLADELRQGTIVTLGGGIYVTKENQP